MALMRYHGRCTLCSNELLTGIIFQNPGIYQMSYRLFISKTQSGIVSGEIIFKCMLQILCPVSGNCEDKQTCCKDGEAEVVILVVQNLTLYVALIDGPVVVGARHVIEVNAFDQEQYLDMNCATQLKATQLVYSTGKSGRDGKAGNGSRVVMGNSKPFQQVKTMLKKRPEISTLSGLVCPV